MLVTLVTLVALAQQPAAAPGPAWYWTDVFGQRIQIYGVQLADGRISWHPESATQLAPAEAERRHALASASAGTTPRAKADAPAPNYGLLVEAMASGGREIRASDPETLRQVREAVGDLERCPPDQPDDDDLGRKPGIIERAEDELQRMLIYGLAGCLAIAGVVIVAQARSKSQA